ncbi:hypothetical protein TIFTF001_040579 [Ficus carica]|uniref:Uncharacterized protein n=1 Tax=Ficus carica TaxID=3494 RepID=A0AA87YVJ1_FICCA|nr:hypothetical protein TIFTF001_040571 [Ficus carica]GMN24494.1 hypothetical protein TIFTF001_040572 [Ficus carica]GMN24550.1 hypothetical protein TIFTF001_040578 [Ficus carica]GMN24567.1 hypothetical protein TIFTF001_040579 [Ficus carica]
MLSNISIFGVTTLHNFPHTQPLVDDTIKQVNEFLGLHIGSPPNALWVNPLKQREIVGHVGLPHLFHDPPHSLLYLPRDVRAARTGEIDGEKSGGQQIEGGPKSCSTNIHCLAGFDTFFDIRLELPFLVLPQVLVGVKSPSGEQMVAA